MHILKFAALALTMGFSGQALAQESAAPAPFTSISAMGPYGKRQLCDRAKPVEKNVVVETGVDGDTVYIRAKSGSYSIRMIGMDTPETHYMGSSQGEWGETAADRLKEILPEGTKVRLEFSPDVCDKYGRILAHVFKDEMHVNREMVKEGLAVNYCMFPSVAYCTELSKEVAKAIKNRTGMFGDSKLELPYDFRRRISNRRQASYVGSIRTKLVQIPGNQDKVPVAERIFFSRESDVKNPYHVVEE